MQEILTLNSGSSSLKFCVFQENAGQLVSSVSGNLSGIGQGSGRFVVKPEGRDRSEVEISLPDHDAAISRLMSFLLETAGGKAMVAVGHRIVHGGQRYVAPHIIDDELILELESLKRFAPLHLPPAIATLRAARKAFASSAHVACFDTSFHRNMPLIARHLPLTRELFQEGVEKYGFHGLSYEFIVSELGRRFGDDTARARLVVAHLGNGSSMTAIKDGRGVETTMGFSPAGGLMMGTRCGDIDPGLVTYFCSEHSQRRLSPAEFSDLVNNRSGLLGISGVTSDMQALLARESESESCRLAVDMYCYVARRHIGALAASLGGLDALVFTGGIGENSVVIRKRICDGLGFLGIAIDGSLNLNANCGSASEISATGSGTGLKARTFVIRTNEELMIARHCQSLLLSLPASA